MVVRDLMKAQMMSWKAKLKCLGRQISPPITSDGRFVQRMFHLLHLLHRHR
jgi:hypothetical protein